MNMRVLEFMDVQRSFSGNPDVLNGISFTVEAGEVVGLLGRNGAGKTTMLRIAMGMLTAHGGQVKVFGMDPREDAVAIKKQIGYVAENHSMPPFMRISDVIRMHRSLFSDWDTEMAGELINRFKLPLDQKVGGLSKGQTQQVALLCAVAHRPPLLVLDEPAGGLDPAARRLFLETSIRHLSDTGSTILFSSHHMTDIERLAGRLLMVHEGQIWIDSDVDSIREGYCLALLPVSDATSGETLLSLDNCLCVRERDGVMRAVFEASQDRVRQSLGASVPQDALRISVLDLEEMFIELVGGAS
jgi:ABC-2 type transport system ATP-binding protein